MFVSRRRCNFHDTRSRERIEVSMMFDEKIYFIRRFVVQDSRRAIFLDDHDHPQKPGDDDDETHRAHSSPSKKGECFPAQLHNQQQLNTPFATRVQPHLQERESLYLYYKDSSEEKHGVSCGFGRGCQVCRCCCCSDDGDEHSDGDDLLHHGRNYGGSGVDC